MEIKFYNVPTGMSLGIVYTAAWSLPNATTAIVLPLALGHLAGGAACHLAPLLRCGFVASR